MKLIVAKSGVNALTATDPNDFIFHSDYNTFKIIKQDIVQPVLADTGGVESVYEFAHGLGYTPFVFAFCSFDEFSTGRASPPGTKDSASDFWFTRINVGSVNVEFNYVNNTGGNYNPTFIYIACEIPL